MLISKGAVPMAHSFFTAISKEEGHYYVDGLTNRQKTMISYAVVAVEKEKDPLQCFIKAAQGTLEADLPDSRGNADAQQEMGSMGRLSDINPEITKRKLDGCIKAYVAVSHAYAGCAAG
ncbi:MAG: hypothetical protein JWM96_614 [Alphaproteobacteria bacterium]|nr:hypothetical protein [Alphaproteobacteria bacterium]